MAPARVHGHLRTTFRGLLAACFATLMVVTLPGTYAHADPTVAQIEAKIQSIWNDAEPLIEQYNAVHEKYKKNKAKQAALEKKIAPLQTQVDLAQLRIGVIAAQVYKGQGPNTFNAILSAGSPRILAEQLSFLDQMTREQERQIAGVTQMKGQYDAQKIPLDKLVAELAAQDADLAVKRKVIEAKLDELQTLRIKAYGTTGGTGSYRPWTCPADYLPTKGYTAASYACKQTGKAYVWAAAGPNSFDCSGLTLAAWAKAGIALPHNAADQYRSMKHYSLANAQVGDLAFTNGLSHVAILVGKNKTTGKWMVVQAQNPILDVRMTYLEDAGSLYGIGRPG